MIELSLEGDSVPLPPIPTPPWCNKAGWADGRDLLLPSRDAAWVSHQYSEWQVDHNYNCAGLRKEVDREEDVSMISCRVTEGCKTYFTLTFSQCMMGDCI